MARKNSKGRPRAERAETDADLERIRRVMEIRRSSAASPRPSGRTYRRDSKYADLSDE